MHTHKHKRIHVHTNTNTLREYCTYSTWLLTIALISTSMWRYAIWNVVVFGLFSFGKRSPFFYTASFLFWYDHLTEMCTLCKTASTIHIRLTLYSIYQQTRWPRMDTFTVRIHWTCTLASNIKHSLVGVKRSLRWEQMKSNSFISE